MMMTTTSVMVMLTRRLSLLRSGPQWAVAFASRLVVGSWEYGGTVSDAGLRGWELGQTLPRYLVSAGALTCVSWLPL